MEDFNTELDNHLNENTGLTLSGKGKADFKSIANWCLFFAILGILFCLMMLIGALGMTATLSAIPGMGGFGGIFTFVYVLMAAIYALPVYYMFKFSTQMKSAIVQNNSSEFNLAINKLKKHFMIMGIFTIIVILLYAIIFFAMIGGMASGMGNDWAL